MLDGRRRTCFSRDRAAVRAHWVALLLAWACGCRADPHYAKQPAIDLDAGTAPVASDFSSETTLEQRYADPIMRAFDTGVAGGFSGVARAELRYHAFKVASERAAIVLLPDRAEPVRMYAEVIADLTAQGYSVFALDHRGQGESQRLTKDPQLGYVEYFHDYVDDLAQFIDTIVKPDTHPHAFLLAHSLGAGIAVLYLDEHPDVFDAVTLVSPLIELHAGLPTSLAFSWAGGACSRSSGEAFALGETGFDPNLQFADNDLTRSQVRFELYRSLLVQHPELQLGGASERWLCETVQATSLMQTLGRYARVPILMLQAGHDEIAAPDGQNRYCDEASRCQKLRYADAYHQILNERDAIKNDALVKLVRFFQHFEAE